MFCNVGFRFEVLGRPLLLLSIEFKPEGLVRPSLMLELSLDPNAGD